VKDGCICREAAGGNIYTKKEYGDFILEIDWKIALGGNSGITYRLIKYGNRYRGLEHQLLDDERHPGAKRGGGKRKTACLYDLLIADTAKAYRKAGEWNTTKIVARGPKVEHWLNGEKVLEYDASSEDFIKLVQESKFKTCEGFATTPRGRIMLQSHTNSIWFRSIYITSLAATE